MAKEVIRLKDMGAGEVPKQLRPEYYFDFEKHPFAHRDLFKMEAVKSVVDAIVHIDLYARKWLTDTMAMSLGKAKEHKTPEGSAKVLLEEGAAFAPAAVIGGEKRHTIYVGAGASVIGCYLYADHGDIYIGPGTTVEPGAGIKGPCIIGSKCEIRQGAYFRGDVITGDGGTFRGEIKNAVLMNGANFPHPGYVGDSLCGFKTHFGNQATTANLGIYYLVGGKQNVVVEIDGVNYDLGRPKIGMVMGDDSQVGCNSVSDPGTFLAPMTIVYQLSRLNKGFYGPNEVLKNKPIEHGIIERSGFKPF